MIPIAFPERKTIVDQPIHVLAADVGGTKTNLALFKAHGDAITSIKTDTYPSRGYNSFSDVAKAFLGDISILNRVCLGIAGPVVDGRSKGTNLTWRVDAREVMQKLQVNCVHLLNDLEINAYGMAALRPEEIITVNEGEDHLEGNVALISPGTGLGEAGLFWEGERLHPFATEGGHCDFSPRSDLDIDLLKYLRNQFGRVSWERLISGPGIYNIFKFLRDDLKRPVPEWLAEQIKAEDPPKVISEASNKNCAICKETIQLFTKYLAIESANLALKIKSTGGLYIGGGIVPKIIDQFSNAFFLAHFIAAGRLQPILTKTAIKIILNPDTALLGAAYYGAYGQNQTIYD